VTHLLDNKKSVETPKDLKEPNDDDYLINGKGKETFMILRDKTMIKMRRI
jgi:hypothetical protein